MVKKRLPVIVKKIFKRAHRLFPEKITSTEFSQGTWDMQFAAGKWEYLSDLSELSRYSIITGYVHHFNTNAAVLDVGCGAGILFSQLKNFPISKYKGIDLSSKAIELACENHQSKEIFINADGKSFTDNERYDIVIFNESLYYFDDCLPVLSHYQCLLNTNGIFIVSMVLDTKSDSQWAEIDKAYRIIDAVTIKNRTGITWTCKVLKPFAVQK